MKASFNKVDRLMLAHNLTVKTPTDAESDTVIAPNGAALYFWTTPHGADVLVYEHNATVHTVRIGDISDIAEVESAIEIISKE